MKRFLVLLLLVAGGLAWASFSVPSNAAVVNGQSISSDQLNSDLTAIAKSADYPCYLKAQEAVASQGQDQLPPVQGAGLQSADGPHTTTSSAFAAWYLGTQVGDQVVLQLAAQHHVHVTAAELGAAQTALRSQISDILSEVSGSSFQCTATSGKQVLDEMPASFVQRSVQFEATLGVLEQKLSGIGSSTADLQKLFDANRSAFATTCFTIATYTTQDAAEAAKALLYEGASFASIAAKTTNGGPAGCDVLYSITSQLPASADLQDLPLNTVSDPIAENGDYLLVEITSQSPTPFASARTYVQQAAESIDQSDAQSAIGTQERLAHVSVNPRYGAWTPVSAQVIVPSSPPQTDVLNSGVNAPPADTSASG